MEDFAGLMRRLFRGEVIGEFLLQNDALFAELTLAEDELKLYRQIHAHREQHDWHGHGGAPAHAPPQVTHFLIATITAAFGFAAFSERIFLQGHAALRAGTGFVRAHSLAHRADVR
jgi:hypothetical protein